MTELIYPPQCETCRRLIMWPGNKISVDEDRFCCEAFPDGIPQDIHTGEFDHTEPHDGDHGLRYLKLPEEETAGGVKIKVVRKPKEADEVKD